MLSMLLGIVYKLMPYKWYTPICTNWLHVSIVRNMDFKHKRVTYSLHPRPREVKYD